MAAPKLLFCSGFVFGLLVFLWPKVHPFIALVPLFGSGPPHYSVRILSYDPLMIYVEGFIPESEREYLLRLGEPLYIQSRTIKSQDKTETSKDRTSSSAYLPNDDPVVQRIMARAAEFQGIGDIREQETLQLTRYHVGQQYRPHWDHDQKMVANRTFDRVTTIFAVLDATCDKCGTRFPELNMNWTEKDSRWCKFVDCEEQEGITVKAIPGNALFWRNVGVNGSGDARMMHAGLPPEKGVKVGLNMWTWGKMRT